MNNLPFGPSGNGQMSMQPPQNQYGNYSQSYTPPPPTITFSIIEGRQAVDNFLIGTNVTAFLADFTNLRLYVKERDANNILKPVRVFALNELVQQQPSQQVNVPQIQNEEKLSAMQNEMDELKQMLQSFMSSQQNNQQQNFNKNKGGKN